MNIINAQVEVLKEAFKEKRKYKNIIYGTLEDKVIIGNNTTLYVIPKKECAIDLTNIDSNNVKIIQESGLKGFINDDKYTRVILTNDIKVYDKRTLRVFSKDDEKIYVDDDLLKYFDLKKSTFKGYNSKSPIYIYEYEVMVGMVLPVVGIVESL